MIFDFLFKKQKNKKTQCIDDYVLFHEDEYCQVEIIPAANLERCIYELKEIDGFAEKHKEGLGYTEVYCREDNTYPLVNLKIKTNDLENVLSSQLHRFASVKSGYSSFIKDCENIIAFGFKGFAICLENEGDITKNIWTIGFPRNEKHTEDFTYILEHLGNLELILVDWDAGEVVNLKNREEIENYLRV